MLEGHVFDCDFSKRWHAFLRACSILLLPNLPSTAQEWLVAADEFEQGRLSADELTKVRERAWQFHDSCRISSSTSELSGLRVAFYRLWPEHDTVHWHESAWHFLHFCEEAGLGQEQWWPLLREQFVNVLT